MKFAFNRKAGTFVLLALSATLVASQGAAYDTAQLLRVGAAKRSIVPAQAHIDGIVEKRVFEKADHLQKFNLGGFGIDLGQNSPDQVASLMNQALSTEPAGSRVFRNKAGQDENTNLRLMALQQPGGATVVFVMMDAIGAGNLIQAGVKNAIVAAAAAKGISNLDPNNILFGQTHSHTAADLQGLWGGVPQDWIDNVLYKAAGDAALDAFSNLTPAHLTYKQGYTSDFNNYRRPRIEPNADADGTITLLTATAEDGRVVGNLLQYNAHPTSIGDGNKPRTPHSEYILGAMDWLEQGGGTALYFNGPIADASPAGGRPGCTNREAGNPDPRANAFGGVRCRGEGIADYLLQAKNVVSGHELAPTIEAQSVQVVLPITNPAFLGAAAAGIFNKYYNFAELPVDQIPGLTPSMVASLPQLAPVAVTTVSRVTLGGADTGLEVVSVPGETTNTFGNYIRGLAKTKVMLLGLTHNSFGYLLPEEEFSYVAQDGDNGFTAPFTGYEEFVSLGPLSAPLLRTQGYNPLFGLSGAKDIPPTLSGCFDPGAPTGCVLTVLEERFNLAVIAAETCFERGPGAEGCPLRSIVSYFPFEFPGAGNIDEPLIDSRLIAASAEAQLRGCDMLDPSNCLFPFPSDWFTVKAADGSPQSAGKGGTGKRVNFNVLAMPRNVEGKPIDPTEWNRNDGFSPGALIVTYVPGIGTVKGADGKPLGPIAGAVPLSDLKQYLNEDAPILVVDAETGERWPIWAEIDLNAGYLLPMQGFGPRADKTPALLIRPAKNFVEGRRYVVVLRNLKNDYGAPIYANAAFSVCRDTNHDQLAALPVVQARCDELEANVFPVLAKGNVRVARDASLYLAWDFTVASKQNDVGRLAAMRDDAFASLGDTRGSAPGDAGYPAGRAPAYTVTKVTENPDGATGRTVRRIEGSITVPSYVTPADPSPADADTKLQGLIKRLPAEVRDQINDGPLFAPSSLSLPPNRLNFVPDGSNPCAGLSPQEVAASQCAAQARYGNGKPVRNPAGDLSFTFTCNIPRSAVNGAATMAAAKPGEVHAVRPFLYGHGLLGGQGEGNGQASDFGNRYGLMACAADWFGFASGDIGTVASALVDLSQFAAIPDGSQQGMLNQMFLARLAVHPDGFSADPLFQVQGVPVLDRREVFYAGNSQGGILGGVLVAASKDIQRGVLGVIGMNYSTLLARSTDFALYSVPLYLSYQSDLDRPFVMSLMQMLWDRSENNGYAGSITDNSAMHGPDNEVLLHPAFGDHQVTMYSADVMARTIGASVDRRRVSAARLTAAGQPLSAADEVELPVLNYADPAQAAGSALVYFDESWQRFDGDRCNTSTHTDPPPVGNLPPNQDNLGAGEPFEDPSIVRNRGSDPHECPRRDPQARCQMSHFMQRANVAAGDTRATLVDPAQASRVFDDYAHGCPAVVSTGAPASGGTLASPDAMDLFFAELGNAIDALMAGDPEAAGTALANAGAQFVAAAQEAATSLADSVTALVTGTDATAPDGVWLAGDLHVHDDHSADGSGTRQTMGQGAPGNVSVADQITFAESQRLDFLPLNDHRTFDQHYDPLWKSGRLLLITGEEANSSPHATVFGAVDMINQADAPAGSPELRRLQQSIWDAHLQGAAWSTAHPDDGETQSVNADGTNFVPNERAFATGPDLAEIWNRGTLTRPKVAYCENRWNNGYRFGVAGASDNHFKEIWAIAGPGQPRTHVLAPDRSTFGVIAGLKAGRTAINLNERAPLATLTGDFDGDGKFEAVGGDEVKLPLGRTATLRISVDNGIGSTVYVYRTPGQMAGAAPYATFTPTLGHETFDFTVTADASHPQDWYRVELRGPGEVDALDYGKVLDGAPQEALDPKVEDQLRAVTSPIFISTGALASPVSPTLPADAGTADNAQLIFGSSADNAFAGFADVAQALGVAHVVAEVRDGASSHVQYRARRADGTLTQVIDLSPSSKLARAPAIAARGYDVWVAWSDDRGSEMPHNPQIFLRHSNDGGLTWQPERQLTHTTGRALRPDIALVDAQTPVVVWEDNGNGAFDVYALVVGLDRDAVNLSSVNKAVTPGNGVDSRSAYYPASVSARVAVRADGTIAVGWQDNRNDVDPGWTGHMIDPTDPAQVQASVTEPGFIEQGTETDDWEIFTAVYSGGAWSAPVNVSNSPAQADRHVALAFDATGGLQAAWDSKDMRSAAGPRLDIRRSRLAPNVVASATSWPAPNVITNAATLTAQRPVFGANGDELSLLWTDGRSSDWRWRVMRTSAAGAVTLTGRGNAAWASYDGGFLAFTSDRAATREQRKPHQVYLTKLAEPAAETAPPPPVSGPADADGDGVADADDECLYVAGDGATGCPTSGNAGTPLCFGGNCISQIPVIGPAIQAAVDSIGQGPGVTPLPARGVFRVGTGQANHDPKTRTCIGGGSTTCGRDADPSTDPNAIRDHLISKATAITGANGQTFMVITTTNIGYFLAYKAEQSGMNGIYDVRLRISKATGVPSTNITVVSDHSHNGPDTIGIWGGVSADYMKITADAVVKAAVDAYNSRRDAVIKVAAINQNGKRESGVPGLDSSYDLAPGNDLARGNPYNEFRLMTADDAVTGERILTFVNYAPHATVTNGDDGGHRLTGDWAAWMPQEAERIYGGMGLATVGALGATDWNKSGNVAQKEAEARSRLRTLMARATAKLTPVLGAGVQVESVFVREPLMQPALLPLSLKPGVDRNNGAVPTDGFDVRIDRSVTPPFLTGDVVGTYVAAARIGDTFFTMFPGEPFGELNHALVDEGRVQGPRVTFLLGGANDFFGYMTKNLDTYEQTFRTGFHFLPGCTDETDQVETMLGIRPEGEGACADHWTLQVSPTFGSHIVCTLQDSADRLGFITANRDDTCEALTALDGLAPPPESDSPLAAGSLEAREAAVQQARELAEQCPGTGAPAEVCAALATGAQQASVYLGTGTETPPADSDGDGVNDADDACPADRGSAADGCPLVTQTAENASCEKKANLGGGRSYQVKLETWDKETVSFQVLEPTAFDCANRSHGAHPVLMDGPGYGGSRITSGYDTHRARGYTVISWDPRGFGDSTGSIRVMDPDYEGRYLVQILDWVEKNLDYLSWRDEATGQYVARPASKSSVAGGVNLVVGSNGGSYGGGYQLLLLTVDAKKRLDALHPDITWHDLRNALNPGDVTKTLWDVALSAVGEGVGHSSGNPPTDDGQDPFIKETLARGAATNEFPRQALDWFHYHGLGHWCGANGLPVMPYPSYGADAVPMLDPLGHDNSPAPQPDGRPGFGSTLVMPDPAAYLKGVSVLLTQGLPDTLFNFNEAWWNAQCLTAAGADVSLYTHNGGHALPYAQSPDGMTTPVDGGSCGWDNAAWFDSKLKPNGAPYALANVCFDLAGSDTVTMNFDQVLAPQPAQLLKGGESSRYTKRDVATMQPVPNGIAAIANVSGNLPVALPLGTVQAAGVIAGMPHIDVIVRSAAGANEAAQDCASPDVPARAGCDSITFVGIGLKKSGSQTPNYKLIDDQVLPIRGLGRHDVDLVGIAERLASGDELALLLYGSHTQFFGAYSRDPSIPAVNVAGKVALPIYAMDAGELNPAADASIVLSTPAAPTSEPVCDPVMGTYCLSQIPTVGPAVQGVIDQLSGTGTPESPANASCAAGKNLGGNRHYQVKIPSASGETISFEVYEPKQFKCGVNGAHPVLLHGHGFGGSRTTSGTSFQQYRGAGYTVISIDQRGFGDSTGTVRVMDPDYEGQDLVRILDWAETNLDYLAYRDEITHAFVKRPFGGESEIRANLVVGSMGGSYGGGYQYLLHNVDPKDRLDAMAADVTWHDLRYSLNPGDTVKSGFDLLLSAGGEQGSYQHAIQDNHEDPTHRGLDPYIVEALAQGAATGEFPREALAWFNYHSPSYWCGLNGEAQMPYEFHRNAPAETNPMLLAGKYDTKPRSRRRGQPAVPMFLSQGFRDTLFNFNDAWWNYQCSKVRGGDARLITHQSGHILDLEGQAEGIAFGQANSRIAAMNEAIEPTEQQLPELERGTLPRDTGLHAQDPGQSGSCASLGAPFGRTEWFNEKLRGQSSSYYDATKGAVCISLSNSDAVYIPDEDLLAPKAAAFKALLPAGTAQYTRANAQVSALPQGIAAQALYLSQQSQYAAVPLFTVADARGLIVAGIPQAKVTVSSLAGANEALCAQLEAPTTRTGCDSTVFLGLGVKRNGVWTAIDEQVQPVRGIGTREISLVGVAERLRYGDTLGLMVYGYHPYFISAASRDPLLPAVNVSAELSLPLYAVDQDGKPVYTPASSAIQAVNGGEVVAGNEPDTFAGCLFMQDPEQCANAAGRFAQLANLADCPTDSEEGIYCAANVVSSTAYDAAGGNTLIGNLEALLTQCYASPTTSAACELVRSEGGAPDRGAVLSEMLDRGDLVYSAGTGGTPSVKIVDGDIGDWMGRATMIGGTDIYDIGENIYTDFLFDAYGADDGDDVRRLAAAEFAAGATRRAERIDALQQAAGDELGIGQPVGFKDHYGDLADREDGTDLTEVRWAADGSDAFLLARFAQLRDASALHLIVLADTDDSAGMNGLDAGLHSSIFDRAVVIENGSATLINLATGAKSLIGQVAVNTAGWTNAVEAKLPLSAIARSGALRIAVLTAKKSGTHYTPANVAYRFDEPVAMFGEHAQALALYAGTVDIFAKQIPLSSLTGGATQTARPGPGYHERQFVSGDNISFEADRENGRLQPYGLYVPESLAVNVLNQPRVTFWTHYRGGKAHSGGSWTPRLLRQLGDEQGNLVVTPRARGTSTWYTTRAHQDFFEVFADVAGRAALNQYADENLYQGGPQFSDTGLFDIDRSRVYISGYSMGGFATYLFGGLYPDLFAGGFATSGAVTQGAWTGIGPDDPMCAEEPAYIPGLDESGNPCFIEANGSRANAQLNYRILDNLMYVPLVINHGTNDELALTPGAERMGLRMAELGYRYDMTTFIGYEHYTQAIVDEWADGAHYLNRFARPENPRTVSYKLVPALVKAVNEVQPGGSTGGFSFHPDGAYWIDNIHVAVDNGLPGDFGQITVTSGRLPGSDHVAVPRTGSDLDTSGSTPSAYVSTPVYSPVSHSTPYIRHAMDWQETATVAGDSNSFSAKLVNVSGAQLDMKRMGFAGHYNEPIAATVESDGGGAGFPAVLILQKIDAPMTACVNGEGTGPDQYGDFYLFVPAGVTNVKLLPGLGQSCSGGGTTPPATASGDATRASALCAAYGVAGSEPFCAAMATAEDSLRSQCEDFGAPEGFCTLANGNLHALIDTCYANDPSEGVVPACRVVAALVEGVAASCREITMAGGQPNELCALAGGTLVSEGALRRYEASWVHQALALQERLGYGLGFKDVTLLHSHNSFNYTTANTPPTLSGSDYNQHYSMADQMRMDIRAIEMDVHWQPGKAGSADSMGFEPMLCHGQGGGEANFGCTSERPLREGLQEFRAWIDAHPDTAVMLYIEDDLGGYPVGNNSAIAHATTAQVVEDEIGALVYRPADHGSACNSNANGDTASSWLNVTRAQMLAAGKPVLLVTESCDSNGSWSQLFHQMNGGNWKNGQSGGLEGFAYPDCKMPDDPTFMDSRGKKITRIWEDSTLVSAAISTGQEPPAKVTPEIMREAMRCGMNLPGVDRLSPNDGRLEAAVWSWAPGEPSAAGSCAKLNANGRFVAANCAEAHPFACVSDANPSQFSVSGAGAFAAAACPAGTHFGVPSNGYANEKLKSAANGAEVWLNYSNGGSGWIANAGAAPATTVVVPPPAGGDSQCAQLGLPDALCTVFDTLVDTVSNRIGDVLGPAPAVLPAGTLPGTMDPGAGLSRYVDPRIGSFPPGFTNPGPSAPYGMTLPGPDTEGPLNFGGYYFHNQLVSGFSQVHVSAGVYKTGYFPMLPFTGGAPDLTDLPDDHTMPAYSSSFDHATEVAEAGYYATTLTRYPARVELTTSERATMHRYTFLDPTQKARVLIDASRTLDGREQATVEVNGSLVQGHLMVDRNPVFFALRANRAFTASPLNGSTYTGNKAGVILDFADATPMQVTLKMGISYTDAAGALANLDAEIPGWDFDGVRKATVAKWDVALKAIEVEGGTPDQLVSFYSALYRAQQWPNVHSDVDGRYRGPDQRVHAADGHTHYSQFSSWDSYRGQNQLQAEIVPERYNEMLHSLLSFYEEAGYLPRWQEGSYDASHMSGDPIIPFVGEAWCRGQIDAPLRSQLYPAMAGLVTRRDAELLQNGYLSDPPVPAYAIPGAPSQVPGIPSQAGQLINQTELQPVVDLSSSRAGTTLEYGLADFSLALMAQQAEPGAASAIADRSLNYRNLLDPGTKWIRPRMPNGDWLDPFQPELGYGFQEGNSWQYSWLAMHDYAGVISRMGGDVPVNQRLDTFFGFPFGDAPIVWPTIQNQITAFGIYYIGNQYAPGNEHDLEAPYVYAYSGEPWKTQAVSRAAASIYTPTINGLPGNDDLGALSGWLVWNMAGVYPINPGATLAVIGSPVFTKVTMHRPGGDLVIEAPGANQANEFVQSVAIDGVASDRAWLNLPRGASTIRIEMGAAPVTDFGAAQAVRPPSLTTHSLQAFGCSVAPNTDDSDADGIVDGRDQCPGSAGAASNSGCPVTQPEAIDPLAKLSAVTDLGASLADALATFFGNVAANAESLLASAMTYVDAITAEPASAPAVVIAAADELQKPVAVQQANNPWLRRPPLNISHRGGEQDYPENTMYAYAESIREAGSDMIEMDIYETADHELVVIHDDTVTRTTNGTGKVSDFTLAQLRELDAAYWHARNGATRLGTNHNRPREQYVFRGIATGAKPVPADIAALGYGPADFRIPTLREIFENPHFANVKINIELKPDPDSTGQYEARLAKMIRDYGRGEDVIVASFLDHNSTLFKLNAPEIATSVPTIQVAVAKGTGNPPFSPADENPGSGVTLGHKAFQVPTEFSGVPVINKEFIDDAHARGLAVQAWTINDEATMIQLLNWCVDGIMSDEPILLERVLQSDKWSCPLDEPADNTLKAYVGSLHEHSGFSDGAPGKTPADYFAAGKANGLAFVGSSEHSDNARLPVTANADCVPEQLPQCVNTPPAGIQKWDETARIADAANDPGTFSAIRGFEWTSDRFGHINVFFSKNDLNAKSGTGYAVSMEDFWQWFALGPEVGGGADGLAVFNHPGREEDVNKPLQSTPIGGDPAYTWNDFEYRPEADARVVGLEMYGKGGDYYDTDHEAPIGGWLAHALDKGWHVAPMGAEDEHGTEWTKASRAKTVILATANTRKALREALEARRFYAVAFGHNDVRIAFTSGANPMGSRMTVAAGLSVPFHAEATGAGVARIEAIGPGGLIKDSADAAALDFRADSAAGESWRFVRVLDASGKVLAVSAPIWFGAGGSVTPPVASKADAGDCLVSLDPAVCSNMETPDDANSLIDDVLVALLGEHYRNIPGYIDPSAPSPTRRLQEEFLPHTPTYTLATLANKNWTGTLRGPFRNDKPLSAEGKDVDAGCPDASTPESNKTCAASRVFYVHEPKNYTGSETQKLPLVVYLHGCNQNAIDAAVGTRWSALADEKHFLVAYPQQRNFNRTNADGSYAGSAGSNQGNGTLCWNWYDPAQGQGHNVGGTSVASLGQGFLADEPAIIANIVDKVASNWNVDRERVYVLGASAGADMSVALGVNYPNVFAAIGSLAGCAYPDCQVAPDAGAALITTRWTNRPVPMIAGNGTIDGLNPAAADLALAQEWVAAHDLFDGTPNPQARLPAQTYVGKAEGDGHGMDYRLDRYRDDLGCTVVDHYLIAGIGHAYPYGDTRGSYTNAGGPDATRAAYEFFMHYTLHGAPAPAACE